ncbi:MAG: ribulose-phosphate 3-epimerase [Lachnospiraceae bacterium]|nr:ribulose-phosphate 3-epimerase [Lachnospiraceae bacterium]
MARLEYLGRNGLVLAPSILSADFSKLGEDVKLVHDANYVHLDVMDGSFVPNISFGPDVIKSVRPYTDRFFDVHLMVVEPVRYVENFVNAGADSITVHVEACDDVLTTLDEIKELGVKTALAVNPETPIEEVYPFLEKTDMILVMSVHPGFGGQSFIADSLDKIKTLSKELIRRGYQDKIDIEVDGGITLANVKDVVLAGANIIVAGSAVYKGDAISNIKAFHDIFDKMK